MGLFVIVAILGKLSMAYAEKVQYFVVMYVYLQLLPAG